MISGNTSVTAVLGHLIQREKSIRGAKSCEKFLCEQLSKLTLAADAAGSLRPDFGISESRVVRTGYVAAPSGG